MVLNTSNDVAAVNGLEIELRASDQTQNGEQMRRNPNKSPGSILINCIFAIALAAASSNSYPASAQQRQAKPEEQPFVVEYYYKAKWGYADEFLRLFKKNHFPVLKKQLETGRILKVEAVRPRYHTTEGGRWDYRVTIVFRNVAAATDNSAEEAIIRQLYPDQETFKREEQRRFEILIAHWDVPLVGVQLDQ
jgi:hypothetical protein